MAKDEMSSPAGAVESVVLSLPQSLMLLQRR